MAEPLDCLIIGAGPAGLTAAIYLARFHLKIGIIEAGHNQVDARIGIHLPKNPLHHGV